MRTYLITFSLLISSVLYAQTEVISGVTRGKDYGVVYSLPKSEIDIEIVVQKVTYTPGEFSRYADRYLRLNNTSGDPEEYWELIRITPRAIGVPDKDNTHFVKMKDKTVAPLIELTKEGLIKSINVPIERIEEEKKAEKKQTPKKVDPRNFLTEEILTANSSAKMAELVSKEIYNIRESRNALVRGQADNMPTDGEQLRLMLENLDLQEKAMIEMFAGTRTKEEKIYNVRLTPNKEYNNEVVLRFSRKLGIVPHNDLAGEPIYLTLKDLHSISIPEEDDKKKKTEGVPYNVPGKASITITNGKQKLYEGEMLITQFGIVEYLAPALFNKNSEIKVYFNPESGSLKKVERE